MNKNKYTFIDLFAGCGGLSLGLIKAGFNGIFAIEKNKDAFSTLIHNLDKKKINNGYDWPTWLPCQNMTTSDLLLNFNNNLNSLKDKIDVVAGGPPCQGFSFAGLRNPNDPRNRLTEEYLEIVSLLSPKLLILENVKGFQSAFKNGKGVMKQPYSDYVTKQLESSKFGYKVFRKVLLASNFAVPQSRPRFLMIAIKKELVSSSYIANLDNDEFYDKLLYYSTEFKNKNNLNKNTICLKDAISDLKIKNRKLKSCVDSDGFMQLDYREPKKVNDYLKFIRKDCDIDFEPNSLRIPKHKPLTLEKFRYILDNMPTGGSVTKNIREKLNIKKQCLTLLSEKSLATTTTTSPDDCIHYSEPRVLTVRENARIQSFPDWFDFKGKYTTGGLRRRIDCPRYSQVGNAVPPLMSEIIGGFLLDILKGK